MKKCNNNSFYFLSIQGRSLGNYVVFETEPVSSQANLVFLHHMLFPGPKSLYFILNLFLHHTCLCSELIQALSSEFTPGGFRGPNREWGMISQWTMCSVSAVHSVSLVLLYTFYYLYSTIVLLLSPFLLFKNAVVENALNLNGLCWIVNL